MYPQTCPVKLREADSPEARFNVVSRLTQIKFSQMVDWLDWFM